MSFFKKLFKADNVNDTYKTLHNDEATFLFNLFVGITFQEDAPIYEIIEKTIHFLEAEKNLEHDVWVLRYFEEKDSVEAFTKFNWADKIPDTTFFQAKNIVDKKSHSEIRFSGKNYAITISNAPHKNALNPKIFNQPFIGKTWNVYVESLFGKDKDFKYAKDTYTQRLQSWRRFLELFVKKPLQYLALDGVLFRGIDNDLSKLNEDFCANIKTRELIKYINDSEIKDNFYNPENFWHLWDEKVALENGYHLCYRYLDKVDFFEFKDAMIAQTTASYLDDSNEKDASLAVKENPEIKSTDFEFYGINQELGWLDIKVNIKNELITKEQIFYLENLLENGYENLKINKLTLKFPNKTSALNAEKQLKALNIHFQFMNERRFWEKL